MGSVRAGVHEVAVGDLDPAMGYGRDRLGCSGTRGVTTVPAPGMQGPDEEPEDGGGDDAADHAVTIARVGARGRG